MIQRIIKSKKLNPPWKDGRDEKSAEINSIDVLLLYAISARTKQQNLLK